MTTPTTIFAAHTTNDTTSFAVPALDALRHQNAVVYVWGTWGAATAKVQVSPDGVTFFDFPNNSLTANGFVAIPVTCLNAQVVVSGGTAQSLNASVL
jgi:hypothetical protein